MNFFAHLLVLQGERGALPNSAGDALVEMPLVMKQEWLHLPKPWFFPRGSEVQHPIPSKATRDVGDNVLRDLDAKSRAVGGGVDLG